MPGDVARSVTVGDRAANVILAHQSADLTTVTGAVCDSAHVCSGITIGDRTEVIPHQRAYRQVPANAAANQSHVADDRTSTGKTKQTNAG